MDTGIVEPASDWARIGLTSIEALKDAVLGAGVDAVQLSAGSIRGSLLFGVEDSFAVSSAHILGRVKLGAVLSRSATTIGVGLRIVDSRQDMQEITTGCIGIFRPNEYREAVISSGSLYASVTMDDDEWEALAAEQNLVLDCRTLGNSRIAATNMPTAALDFLRMEFNRLHMGDNPAAGGAGRISRLLLRTIIAQIAREPRPSPAPQQHGYARIAAQACRYIEENLSRPLSISAITRAAHTSHRSLYRAFQELLGETPQSYVRKLRLNRIRRDLTTHQEAHCTVAVLANRWGMSELGRLSSEYRTLFGELPSTTRDAVRGTA